jgi:Ca2+-binding RTX toxin-like protein
VTEGGSTHDRARVRRPWRRTRLIIAAVLLLAPSMAVAQAVALLGTPGNDTISGSAGADAIFGLGGNDTINGGPGNDDLDGGPGADDIHGGAGNDAVLYGDRRTAVVVTLDDTANDGAANDGVAGEDNVHSDIEEIYGGVADDYLTGNGASNLFDGGGGDDAITDGGGVDRVYGGAGDDVITTFDGKEDILDCGPGKDSITSDRDDLLIGCEKRVAPRRVRAGIDFSFSFSGGRARVDRLTVSHIPKGGRVELSCRGGCPISVVRLPAGRSHVALASLFRRRRLGFGATIEVRITHFGSIGKVRVFRLLRNRAQVIGLCLTPGGKTPKKRC